MLAAVRASISTPVLASRAQRATTRTESGWTALISTLMAVSSNGWQSGISSWQRLAAMMPAMRATANTSPLGWPPDSMARRVSGFIRNQASATASRRLAALPVTSTICAWPRSSRWVRRSEKLLGSSWKVSWEVSGSSVERVMESCH
ncbi:hypothetical protein D3C77_606540 [compost metagenome]